MSSLICIIGGCNGTGKSTLARELLPRLGIGRFLNVDLIAKGLSPVKPSLAAFAAGRRLLEEAHHLIESGGTFAIESTLSGKTYVKLLRGAKERGALRGVQRNSGHKKQEIGDKAHEAAG